MGIEDRLDEVAEEQPHDPDTGQVARLRYTPGQLAERAHDRRARQLQRAHDALDEYRRLLDPV